MSELRLWHRYLSAYPAPLERIEYQLAALTAKLHNVNLGKGKSPLNAKDFILFKYPESREEVEKRAKVEASSRYSALDREIMKALRGNK